MNRQPQTLQTHKTLQHDYQLIRCRFNADNSLLFAAGYDGFLSRWNLASGQMETFDAHHGWVEGMVISPDRQELYTADSWGQVHAWRLSDEKLAPRWTIGNACASWLRDLAISPNGQWLATCGNEPIVRVFSTTDGKLVHELKGHEQRVMSVAFADNENLVSGDLLGGVCHWTLFNGQSARQLDASKLFKTYQYYRQGGVRTMTFSADGKTLFCGGLEGTNANQAQGLPTVLAFDWSSGQLQTVMTTAETFNGPVMDLVFHPDGFLIGAGSSEGGGALWFWKPSETKNFHLLKNPMSFRRMDLSSDGSRLSAAAFGNLDGQRGGNGRKLNAKGEYPDFGGNLVVYEWK